MLALPTLLAVVNCGVPHDANVCAFNALMRHRLAPTLLHVGGSEELHDQVQGHIGGHVEHSIVTAEPGRQGFILPAGAARRQDGGKEEEPSIIVRVISTPS